MQCGSRETMMTSRSRLAVSNSCPLQALPRQNRRHRGVEFVRQLADRQSQTLEVDAPEEVPVLVVGVLVGGDNIAAEREQVAGDAGYDAGAVDARDE